MIGTRDIFTVGEVALLNGVSKKIVFCAIRRGELSAVKFNARTIRIQRSALQAWVNLCTVRAASVGHNGTQVAQRESSRGGKRTA